MTPQVTEINAPPEAEAIYALFAAEPYSVFLDSARDRNGLGRYSIIARDPFLIYKAKDRRLSLEDAAGVRRFEGEPLEELRRLLRQYRMEPCGPLPFYGGVIGYFAYCLAYGLESLPGRSADDLGLPDMALGFYDSALIIDHREQKAYIVSSGLPASRPAERARRAAARTGQWREALRRVRPLPPPARPAPAGPWRSNFTHNEYCAMLEKVIKYIHAGDIFQANLSQRFEAPLPAPPYDVYRCLRAINPAPFAAYLNFGETVVASASPERFMLLKDGVAETRPIKGTRPRGNSPEQDELLAAELLGSEKDRAELVMIVDLERNDLGRVAEYGSVRVPDLLRLEKYATVFHLVATVTARLRPGLTAVDLLRAAFPGGSISGAPKVRAMEIIDELEPVRRSIYTGSIGYIGFSGDMDTSIVIRTMIINNDRVYFQAGGGIVADSSPESEYQETLAKAKALFTALGYEVQ